ncbi:helix-turn-helix domain-containing protein, partial [Stackebrandtia soli]|uniref:helix-turn-helix domain-containing protein n=1 Tax=Stackebrandtia soli TaxID=1892856 RepID=UPI0039E8B0E8
MSADRDTDYPTELSDPELLRALAHPARMAILDHLGEVDDLTATEGAELIGLSPSAMSYHLRTLAKVGLLEEAPGRGDG